jgi:hypothetical protein
MSAKVWASLLSCALLLHNASAIATQRCPRISTIDRVEDDTAVLVFGQAGVRTIAVGALHTATRRSDAVREGMTVIARENRCEVRLPSRRLFRQIDARLRALSR